MGKNGNPNLFVASLMQDLLKLYYLLKERNNWPIEEGIIGIREILKKITGYDFEFFVAKQAFCFGHYVISANDQEIELFKEIMAEFERKVKSGKKGGVLNFRIKEIKDEIITTIKGKANGRFDKRSGKSDRKRRRVTKFKIEQNIIKALRTERIRESSFNKVRILSDPYRHYLIDHYSKFVKKLLNAQPQEDPIFQVPSLAFRSWLSIIQIVRAIFVNFSIAFGSTERIKPCRFCQRLFLEKKIGVRLFCSPGCKHEFYKLIYPKEKRLCRERQNAWLRYCLDFNEKVKYRGDLEAKHVYLQDCKKCENIKKTGTCLALKEKNKEFFMLLEK